MSPWEAGRDLRDTPSLGRRHAGAPGAHRAGRARRAGPGRAACGVGRGAEAADHAGPERRVAAAAGTGGVLELARLALSALVVGLAGCGGGGGAGAGTLRVPGEGGRRVTVEVLNASGRGGLARSGGRVLRQAGLGVGGLREAAPAPRAPDFPRL